MIDNEYNKIAEGNKLIAEFMGKTPNPNDGGRTWANETLEVDGSIYGDEWETLKYHKSWDWLMPVIEKCCGLILVLDSVMTYITKTGIIKRELIRLNIERTWQAVVEFIQWYNEQKINNENN